MSMPNPDRGLYSISVAAELTGVGPQTLRLYETKGLLDPARTDGGTRRYSDHDIQLIQRIAELTATGLNLAGVSLVLELEAENDVLREQLTRARRHPDPYES
jgi:DNA-binding transcriptional MerR regulator